MPTGTIRSEFIDKILKSNKINENIILFKIPFVNICVGKDFKLYEYDVARFDFDGLIIYKRYLKRLGE